MNWDDLRFFLALHRAGTLTGAARELDVNHATVSRRIDGLEEAVGGSLFSKTPEGYELTTLGEVLLGPVRDAEEDFVRATRLIRSADTTLGGEVRVATSQLLAQLVVIPAAVILRQRHPEIRLSVLEGTGFSNLARLEADLAVRLQLGSEVTAASTVRVCRAGEISWALYATTKFAEQWGLSEGDGDLARAPVALYDEHAPGRVGTDWIENATNGEPHVVMRTNSMYSMRATVAAGIAAGFLPRPWAEIGDLQAVSETVASSQVFIARHPDMTASPRISAVRDALLEQARSALHDG